jgi:hypothetical protein
VTVRTIIDSYSVASELACSNVPGLETRCARNCPPIRLGYGTGNA